ncbi:MAG: hypothetical protein ACRESO_06020, partial [Gammaproteobacteria bacterium]
HYNCVATLGVGDSERGMLAYYSGIDTRPSWTLRSLSECEVLLIEGDSLAAAKLSGWQLLWNGTRADSRGEQFWLLARTAPPTPALARAAAVSYVGSHYRGRIHPAGSRIHGKQLPPGNPR